MENGIRKERVLEEAEGAGPTLGEEHDCSEVDQGAWTPSLLDLFKLPSRTPLLPTKWTLDATNCLTHLPFKKKYLFDIRLLLRCK